MRQRAAQAVQGLRERLLGLPGSAPAGAGTPETVPGEIGFPGVSISGGIVSDDHLRELRGKAGVEAAVKMRRTHGQVRAVQTVLSLPILATTWGLEPPEQPGAAETEATELLRENLFGGMENSWTDLLRDATLAIYYGWRVPEVVWEERRGLLAVARVAPRNPELVERWLFDPQGRTVGYLYAGNRPTGTGVDGAGISTPRYERVAIPMEKCLHFAFEAENGNPQGFGLWRSMYPHWSIVQAVYKILCMGIEKSLLPVPVGRLHAGAKAVDRSALLTLLQRWRADHRAAVVLGAEQSVDFLEAKRDLMDAMPFIAHHNAMIAVAGLAQFLHLGMGEVGTQALGTVHVQTFMDAEEGRAQWLQETIEQQLIRRWVLLNYGEGLRPPRLMHRRITSRDLGGWAQALQTLTSGGFLHPGVEDEEKLRGLVDLPEIPREQLEARAEEREAAQAEQAAAAAVPAMPARTARETFRCAETDAAAREARIATEGEFVRRAEARLRAMQESYLAALRPLVERATTEGPLSSGVPLLELAGVAVPGAAAYEAFVREFLWSVFEQGRQALHEETGQEIEGRPIPNQTRSWLRARAAVTAADHVARLRGSVLQRVLTGVRAGMAPALIFSDAGGAALRALTTTVERDWAQAAAEVLHLVSGPAPEGEGDA